MITADALVLHSALESAKGERKTGNIHVLAKFSGAIKNAILVVHSGELVGCNYLGKVGKEAIRVLLQAVALKALFVRHDVSDFTPQSGIPSLEDILRELHKAQPAESAAQQSSRQTIPKAYTGCAGKSNRAAEILASVIGEEEARLQIRRIMKQYSAEDGIEEFIEACIDLATSYVGEQIARAMFEEIADQATEA